MSLAASVCVLLSQWISFLLVAVPSRSRRALVELLIHCERAFGVRVPESHLNRKNLASVTALAQCIVELAGAKPVVPEASKQP